MSCWSSNEPVNDKRSLGTRQLAVPNTRNSSLLFPLPLSVRLVTHTHTHRHTDIHTHTHYIHHPRGHPLPLTIMVLVSANMDGRHEGSLQRTPLPPTLPNPRPPCYSSSTCLPSTPFLVSLLLYSSCCLTSLNFLVPFPSQDLSSHSQEAVGGGKDRFYIKSQSTIKNNCLPSYLPTISHPTSNASEQIMDKKGHVFKLHGVTMEIRCSGTNR